MDTRYWGPSGWQLIHLIAFRSPHPEEILLMIKDILPCRFCRESTTKFTHDLPLKGDPGRWAYELHNMVNNKLRTQCKDDPAVVDPGADPKFEEVKKKYMSMKPTDVPGRDFLMSIAANYPEEPEEKDMATQRTFIHKLAEVYPFELMRSAFKSYLSKNEVSLTNQKSYMKWMYGLLSAISESINAELPSYKGYVARVMYFKSGCKQKTYRGKTCRRLPNGFLTKNRDHKRTFRITRQSLLK
jgi:hypothetical protein